MNKHERHDMKATQQQQVRDAMILRSSEQGRAGVILLVSISFLLGIAVSAFLYYSTSKRTGADDEANREGIVLSGATLTVLQGLASPVEIRFYSLLDPTSVSAGEQAFAGRAEQLVAEFQKQAGGKINVTRHTSLSDAAGANAAGADGITAFNRDKGDACYLGLAVEQSGRKESLPRLSPEWEKALEFDLTRVIARVTAGKPAATVLPSSPNTAKATVEEVKRLIPNLASVSLDDGKQILREAALNEFRGAATEIENQIKEMSQRLAQGQGGNSEAGRQAAIKKLQALQADQTEKLKQMSAKLHDQIAALEQLKQQ